MCEEMKKHEAELSDAELGNVSGGGYEISDANIDAWVRCRVCPLFDPSTADCRNGHRKDLARYLLEHGKNSVPAYRECPYYKS